MPKWPSSGYLHKAMLIIAKENIKEAINQYQQFLKNSNRDIPLYIALASVANMNQYEELKPAKKQ